MIVERLTFQAKYGHSDELVALFKEYNATTANRLTGRIYTDVTGTMFTVQAEFEYPDLAAAAALDVEQRKEYETPAFQEWFGKMMAITERGERQYFNVEPLP